MLRSHTEQMQESAQSIDANGAKILKFVSFKRNTFLVHEKSTEKMRIEGKSKANQNTCRHSTHSSRIQFVHSQEIVRSVYLWIRYRKLQQQFRSEIQRLCEHKSHLEWVPVFLLWFSLSNPCTVRCTFVYVCHKRIDQWLSVTRHKHLLLPIQFINIHRIDLKLATL